MIGDLHCHTRLSDGSMSIDDLIFYAKRAGVDFISITDHDTMEGVTRATVLGKRYGITVIPAVEISCFDTSRGRKAHILRYMPDTPSRLQGLLSQNTESTTKAGKRMIRAVTRFYPVTEEHIGRYTLGSSSIYVCHIMQALTDLGYDVCNQGEVFDRLFGKNGLCLCEAEYPDVYGVIETVHEAGGIAVLAHPPMYDSIDLMFELAGKNLLDGIEAYHPEIDADAQKTIEIFAENSGLLVTGGSDFHGSFHRRAVPIASRITMPDDLEALFAYKKRH